MKKQYRLRKNEEFQSIIQKKRFFSCPAFVIYYVKKKEEYSRFGISVGKKYGKAPQRNKAKRQVRMMLQELNATQYSFDAVIIIRSAYNQLDYETNKKHLESLLKKVTM